MGGVGGVCCMPTVLRWVSPGAPRRRLAALDAGLPRLVHANDRSTPLPLYFAIFSLRIFRPGLWFVALGSDRLAGDRITEVTTRHDNVAGQTE